MILKGSQRGGGQALGLHLLKTTENEHVEVHEIRGFVAQTVLGAIKEAQAVSKGTKCKQYLFSVSLSPPETADTRIGTFETALDKIEERLGLTGQPRIVVFHEKEGRRHCHAVWSRIDADTMTAKQLSFFKSKLRDVSKQLYLENGWTMPKGLIDSQARDPRNFSLEEWQQAKRIGLDAGALKGMTQECWAASDGLAAFSQALSERGLYLAKGDRRAHVVVSYDGEVFALARLIDKKSREVTAKLGVADNLPTVAQTKAAISGEIAPKLSQFIREAKQIAAKRLEPLEKQRQAMSEQHRLEREKLDAGQKERQAAEQRQRAERLRKGFAGLWDQLTGEHARTVKRNELEALFSLERDRSQRDALVISQLKERQSLQQQIKAVRRENAERVLGLHRQAAHFRQMAAEQQEGLRGAFSQPARGESRSSRGRDTDSGRRSERSTPTRDAGPKPDAGRG